MQLAKKTMRCPDSRHRQRGIALPLVAAAMVAMIAIVGLAMDASHALANKTRLQTTVDAAALAAAKVYDESADVVLGQAAALSLFSVNADGAGNHELNTAYDGGEIGVVVQWSETLDPFVSTGIGPYVRVIATGFATDATLSAVVGITELGMRASAVAGPSPSLDAQVCNLAPMVVCAEDPSEPDLFGFEANRIEVLKSSAGSSSDIGPGNFQLVRLDCPGGDCVRENMAGSYGGCVSNGEVMETEPGNTVGPSVQGLNTRFGTYSGPVSQDDYPPDVVVDEPNPILTYDETSDSAQQSGTTVDPATLDFGYEQYVTEVANGNLDYPPPAGVYDRRVLAIPIASCSADASGSVSLDVVGFGCFFLLQQVQQKGNEAEIYGQFIEGCNADGMPGPEPESGPSPYRIQLYKDPDSIDS